ncbi:MAG: SIS domain-containing protein, partial [bacterium]
MVHLGAICIHDEDASAVASDSVINNGIELPDLIGRFLEDGLSIEEAIREAVLNVRGAFALCIIFAQSPYKLFAVRRGLPLVAGLADGFNVVASDIGSLFELTRNLVILEDEQLCVIDGKDVSVLDLKNDLRPGKARAVSHDWPEDVALRNGHEHFMKKEIFEQPRAVVDTISEWVEHSGDFFTQIGVNTRSLLDMRRLHFVACGTSFHAALIGRYLIESLARIPVSVDVSSEYRYMKPITENGTLFVSVSQSGETADTVNAQREAKLRGAKTLTICNVEGSTAIKEADFKLLTRAGIEKGVTATKTFTSQIAALTLMALS